MAKYSIEDTTLTNIANAIRAKTGGTAKLAPAAMDEALNNIPTQGAKTVTPGTTDQTAAAKGVFTTGAVTVKGDANLKAENIADGVSIFGVVGSHKGGDVIETCTVEFVVDASIPRDGGVTTYIRTYKNGEDKYGVYSPGKDAFGNVADNVVDGVVCGSYLFIKKDVNYPVLFGTDNVESVLDFNDDNLLKITAGGGETVTFNIYYNDF